MYSSVASCCSALSGLAKHQIEFTEMLVRTAVTAIERQCPLVIVHRRPELPQPAIGIADVVLDVRIVGLAQRSKLERRDGRIPILGDERPLARGEIGVELR